MHAAVDDAFAKVTFLVLGAVTLLGAALALMTAYAGRARERSARQQERGT
ncbi:hypothetical protein GCM10018980_18250 [Streptomyces capoamus]|uniref:Uncharacterized protein n=1 Tax=Streptomyces capoamus TaxID=68183 RepID=A0A919C1N5_9ACTN|nr:hypothetical protein [Streptomyces capoamus]GGW16287.1 hypothetical protein GCM10010501_31870 [Streptomyces libani subsp. rufus]GHG42478.1 hypothetical protein GCM10018980_18250 [Streptomyces capoamus]